MNEADRIWDESEDIFSCWGLREIPFSESASTQNLLALRSQLRGVFTGREKELKDVFNLFKSRERKRILVYGWAGIGKTAFILQVLDVLQRKAKNTLTAYINLPPEVDLATAAFIALARKMKEDEWAQEKLSLMGLRPRKSIYLRKGKVKVGLPIAGGEIEEEPVHITSLPQFPILCFEDLLERALEEHNRVVIAIDDLDKQDPARARKLLHDAQGMLKGQAWFIITGYPSGLTHDILIREQGLFDLTLPLEEFDQPTTHRMLFNYLNSARINNIRYDHDDPRAYHPFTPETACTLCEHSKGVPRWLNRLGCYVLLMASSLQAGIITSEVLQQGFDYGIGRLLDQSNLTAEDRYVLELVLEKGSLSDSTITLVDLEQVGAREFSEILPILEKLV